jgi:hypothetical protein
MKVNDVALLFRRAGKAKGEGRRAKGEGSFGMFFVILNCRM